MKKQASLQHDTTGVPGCQKQIAVLRGHLAEAKATLAQQQAMEHQGQAQPPAIRRSWHQWMARSACAPACRRICPGRDAADGGRTDPGGLYRRQLQGDPADRWAAGPRGCRSMSHLPRPTVHGYVDSHRAGGGRGARTPAPDNATGNFTKIVQRIPVKIDVDKGDPLFGKLRPGMSVEPIDRHKAGWGRACIREGIVTATGDRGGGPPSPSGPGLPSAAALLGASGQYSTSRSPIPRCPTSKAASAPAGFTAPGISTAYLIGEVIVIPLTDFMSRVFSLRRYLLANVALFLLFSVLYGQANEPRRDDCISRAAGLFRRRDDPAGLHDHPFRCCRPRSKRWGSPGLP